MKRYRSLIWRMFSASLTILCWALLGGFFYFCSDALRPSPTLSSIPADCDGIVALTGGQDRIEASINLLKQQTGRDLLISGVSPHTSLLHILSITKLSPLPPELMKRITLGYQAATTIGNAWETAQWAETRHLHHLILVTAGYHMRRAILEFHDIAPQLTLTTYWVQPPAMATPWRLQTLSLMLNQYFKFIGALLRAGLAHQQKYEQEGFRPPEER